MVPNVQWSRLLPPVVLAAAAALAPPSVGAVTHPGHLYASLNGGIALFPLDAHGIPKWSPDRTIPVSAGAVTLGLDGNLYATVVLNSSNQVAEYAAGAGGSNVPIRTLETPLNPFNVIADTQGRVYVGLQGSYDAQVWIYAANASGPAQPLRIIYLPLTNGQLRGIGVALDGTGNLYASSGANVYVFANPVTNPTPIDQFCVAENNAFYGPTLAFSSTGRLFVAIRPAIQRFILPVKGCPARNAGQITLKSPSEGIESAIAVGDGLLYAGALFNGEPAIVVLRGNAFGPQQPLTSDGGTQGFTIGGLAVGP